MPGFDALVPQGAFYLWIKSPVADEEGLVAAARGEEIAWFGRAHSLAQDT